MMGALKPPLRRERTTSRPSVSGKPTSISTRSGALALAALAPLAPVSTADASNSSCSDNCSTSVSRRSVSSSTIRILRALAIGTILLRQAADTKGSVLSRVLVDDGPGLQADWARKLAHHVLIRIQVVGCYSFTRRTAVY